MNAKRINAAAGVVLAAQKQRNTATGIAAALEAAGLLQSPESAAELVALRKQCEQLDKLSDEVMAERDAHHDALDRFAQAVAPEEVIGEHSSGNNPWANAFELVTPAADVDALRARVAELEAQAEKVTAFCAQRAECVTSILNCHPDNAHDYYRWQGHAESRRQLSQSLGLPVAWPAEDKQSTPPAPAEDPHDSPLHQSYALGHDLPEEDPARCLTTHPFSPRDGWRLICGSCDHAEAAPCHREGGAL
ncbi:hypothetical protein ACOMD4_15855 [Streptomyces anulatus]|uniref:hypothetical protein n=1 Tax=Streptomyces anulatus TaxID=1892 RepID=UPI003B7EC22D